MGDNLLPDLSIIIVSWNVRELLRTCLSSIDSARNLEMHALSIEVIVVDSGSGDDSQEMVKNEFPWVRLLAQKENVGFPKGNNIGLREAKGRTVLLLNPDTEIIGDALQQMVKYLDENSGVGAVGAQLLNPDGSVQSSKRRFPTLTLAAFESTWLQSLAPRSLLRHYYIEDSPANATMEVDWLVGACIAVRKEVIEKVGRLDEAYFMYSEELDWCRRIKGAGWGIVYLPSAKILHHVGKSSQQAVTERHINFQRAKLRYFRKFHGRPSATFLRAIILSNYMSQLCWEAIKGLLGHKRPLRRQRVRAYWKVLRSGLRPAGY
jgi:GT2 family glycosyltransferase